MSIFLSSGSLSSCLLFVYIAHHLELPDLVRQMTEPHVDEGQDDGAAHDHKQN